MRSKTALGWGLFLGALALAGCSKGGSGGGDARTALRFKDATVKLGEFEEEFDRRGPRDYSPAKRDSVVLAFANGYLDKLVMADEATHHPRGDTTGQARQLKHRRAEVIRDLYREDAMKDVDLSPHKMEQIYAWLGEQVHIRQIMVESKEQAQKVHDEIRAGLDFNEAVKKYSVDKFSNQNDGRMEWFSYGEIAGLDDAAFPLKVGELSPPTWSRRGWHVAILDERRPRQRDSVDGTPALFEQFYGKRLTDQRWAEFMDTYWRRLNVQWNEPGFDLALTVQNDYRDRYLAKMREAMKLRDEGKQLDESFTQFPRGPQPTPEQGAMVVATVGDMTYTVEDAADDLWETALDKRPDFTQPHVYRAWLQEKITERSLAHQAESSGFLKDPDRARRVREAIEYEHVQALYRAEVFQKARPTPEDLQAFFTQYADWYRLPPDLDLCVFETSDPSAANQVFELLRAAKPVNEIRSAVKGEVKVTARTGLKNAWPEWEGLAEHIRAEGDSVGRALTPIQVKNHLVVARIEDRREGALMTFDQAKPYVLQHCSIALREQRTRAFLDSLRTAFNAQVVPEVVLAAQVTPAQAGAAKAAGS